MTRSRPMRGTARAEQESELDRLSWLLDDVFRLPGTDRRFGLDALIGLIPGVGDVASTGVGLYIIVRALAARVPLVVVGRMLFNTSLDALVGIVPVIGDLFDFAFKSNARNMDLYRTYVADPGRSTGPHRRFLLGAALLAIGLVWLGILAFVWLIGQAERLIRF